MLATPQTRTNYHPRTDATPGVLALMLMVLTLSLAYWKADAAEMSPEVANRLIALKTQSRQLYQDGQYSQAVVPAEEALSIVEKVLGPNHPDTGTSLNNLAMLYEKMGNYLQAEPMFLRALKIYENKLGPNHPANATSLQNLARLYQRMFDSAKAEPLLERALKIREKKLGFEHLDTAVAVYNLARCYTEMGKYLQAEPMFQRALELHENKLGLDHRETAIILSSLAELARTLDDYAKAESLHQRAINIREKTLGPEHPDVAKSLNMLAMLYSTTGDFAKAKQLLQRALTINEKALGPQRSELAFTINNLAQLSIGMGDYAEAEPLFQRALKINEDAMGSEHPQTAVYLNNLAMFYFRLGDFAKAEPLLQSALKINEKTLKQENRLTATTLDDLVKLYDAMGDRVKSEPLFQRALKIHESAFGSDLLRTGHTLRDVALHYYRTGDLPKAEPLYQRALKTTENALGPEHPETVGCLLSLVALYRDMGDYAKAEPLSKLALKIVEKTLGPEDRLTSTTLINRALLQIDMGNTIEARNLVARAQPVQLTTLANILSFTSEEQRLAYLQAYNPFSLSATLGSIPELSAAMLRCKGVVLDSVLEDRQVARASVDPAKRESLDRIAVIKRRLAQLLVDSPEESPNEAHKKRETQSAMLRSELDQLEGVLARDVAALGRTRRASRVSLGTVQQEIPANTVLVELIRYEHYLGKGQHESRYGAMVLARFGELRWVMLGASDSIERTVAEYQQAVRGRRREDALSSILRALHQQVWAPIEKLLPQNCRSILISPDGELNFVSFAILLTEKDQFLGQKYQISYVATGRDLVREKAGKKEGDLFAVWANPAFSKQPLTNKGEFLAISRELRELERSDFGTLRFQQLPGAEREGRMLEQKARGWGYPNVMLRIGEEATEVALQKVSSPTVLHLATHGFFLSDVDSEPTKDRRGLSSVMESMNFQGLGLRASGRILKSPMHRSGLALAGAETTLAAWKRGEAPPPENDGILTAEEVGELNLEGTWLVTLSACDTGMGEARNGEGVLGLRRGFIQAGAQNLLMTLWPVNDQFTTEFMAAFYERAMRSGDAPRALAEVQREYLQKQREFGGIGAAVKLAGPFVMNFQGPASAGAP